MTCAFLNLFMIVIRKKPFLHFFFLLNFDGHLYEVTQNSCKWDCFIIYLPPALLRKQASVTTQIPPSVVLAMNYLNEPGSHAQRNILKSSGDNSIWFVYYMPSLDANRADIFIESLTVPIFSVGPE